MPQPAGLFEKGFRETLINTLIVSDSSPSRLKSNQAFESLKEGAKPSASEDMLLSVLTYVPHQTTVVVVNSLQF